MFQIMTNRWLRLVLQCLCVVLCSYSLVSFGSMWFLCSGILELFRFVWLYDASVFITKYKMLLVSLRCIIFLCPKIQDVIGFVRLYNVSVS